jgi:hypothetical protein
MLADDVRRVISHATPTPRISWPKFARILAAQMRRNTGSRSGAHALVLGAATIPLAAAMPGFPE